ncbi:hypothetical protein M378DRAFT_14897 [Amanita muscaria Koide BX008]|uniref:Uncharacterized protein n=1 Tax=Amanita muscaria (strain Koide BX008) TaxID=946122 RepID=A0A0C2SYP4_AMAMK|nr:hypothetical protein M378DRAFT_14897 [Amanita muscaria Koide BX008]
MKRTTSRPRRSSTSANAKSIQFADAEPVISNSPSETEVVVKNVQEEVTVQVPEDKMEGVDEAEGGYMNDIHGFDRISPPCRGKKGLGRIKRNLWKHWSRYLRVLKIPSQNTRQKTMRVAAFPRQPTSNSSASLRF